jgi:uncharacterized protein YeaO (DUF488 family)
VTLRIVRLGSPRARDEGPRLGTVRRPPRGVPKAEWAKRDFFDLWFPALAPSEGLLKKTRGQLLDPRTWKQFARSYRKEMTQPEQRRLLELLALMSRATNLSVGCYCEDETHCHRSLLRELLREHGAELA